MLQERGEVSERFIEPVSKTGVRLLADRGFESRPLRSSLRYERRGRFFAALLPAVALAKAGRTAQPLGF